MVRVRAADGRDAQVVVPRPLQQLPVQRPCGHIERARVDHELGPWSAHSQQSDAGRCLHPQTAVCEATSTRPTPTHTTACRQGCQLGKADVVADGQANRPKLCGKRVRVACSDRPDLVHGMLGGRPHGRQDCHTGVESGGAVACREHLAFLEADLPGDVNVKEVDLHAVWFGHSGVGPGRGPRSPTGVKDCGPGPGHARSPTLRCLATSSPCRLYTVLVLYSLPASDSGCEPSRSRAHGFVATCPRGAPFTLETHATTGAFLDRRRTSDEVHAGRAGRLAERVGRQAGNRLCVLGEELGPVRRVEAFLVRGPRVHGACDVVYKPAPSSAPHRAPAQTRVRPIPAGRRRRPCWPLPGGSARVRAAGWPPCRCRPSSARAPGGRPGALAGINARAPPPPSSPPCPRPISREATGSRTPSRRPPAAAPSPSSPFVAAILKLGSRPCSRIPGFGLCSRGHCGIR